MERQTLQSERKLKDQIVKNETLMNERVKTELVLKKFKSKKNKLELFIEKYEKTAETNIKCLSEISQETLDMAQMRISWAFRLASTHEEILKSVFEKLVNHSIELKRITLQKQYCDEFNSIKNETCHKEMKHTINFACNVLNLNLNEFDDLMSCSLFPDGETGMEKRHESLKSIITFKRKIMQEFDQILNISKKEISHSKTTHELTNLDKTGLEMFTKILEIISNYERELIGDNFFIKAGF